MQKELIGDFTRRLSQCNKGEMIVIIYDIYFAHAQDAKEALATADHPAYKEAVHKAQRTLNALIGALDFSYPIANNLYALYLYARNALARALYENRVDGIMDAERVMKRLYSSFVEAAKQDTSAPLMSNTQQVYAGMTYGRSTLNENLAQTDYNRGFLV
jgi:flagellar protein FliS